MHATKILCNMKNSKELLAQELSVLYPDVTDAELNEMADRLIEFFTIGVKAIYEAEKSNATNDASITDIDVN